MENQKTVTVLEATKKWVGEFNAINQSLISRLMQHEMDNWHEITTVSVGDSISVYGEACNLETGEYERVSGTYEVIFINKEQESVSFYVDGVEYAIEYNEADVERYDYLPMWGTMWMFGESLDESWAMENLDIMSNCGFRIYEDCETGDIYFGIDGAGYDFFEAHWIPLYKARGLKWHKTTDEVA